MKKQIGTAVGQALVKRLVDAANLESALWDVAWAPWTGDPDREANVAAWDMAQDFLGYLAAREYTAARGACVQLARWTAPKGAVQLQEVAGELVLLPTHVPLLVATCMLAALAPAYRDRVRRCGAKDCGRWVVSFDRYPISHCSQEHRVAARRATEAKRQREFRQTARRLMAASTVAQDPAA